GLPLGTGGHDALPSALAPDRRAHGTDRQRPLPPPRRAAGAGRGGRRPPGGARRGARAPRPDRPRARAARPVAAEPSPGLRVARPLAQRPPSTIRSVGRRLARAGGRSWSRTSTMPRSEFWRASIVDTSTTPRTRHEILSRPSSETAS